MSTSGSKTVIDDAFSTLNTSLEERRRKTEEYITKAFSSFTRVLVKFGTFFLVAQRQWECIPTDRFGSGVGRARLAPPSPTSLDLLHQLED